MQAPSIASAATTVNTFVRFFFYLFGMLVFAGIAYFMQSFWKAWPKVHNTSPAFSVSEPKLARLNMTSRVITSFGDRAEMRQYGQPHDRDTDLTVVMVLPRESAQIHTRTFAAEIGELRPILRGAYSLTPTYYDLETRFGSVRAAEFTATTDGRAKLCIAWLTRFETAAVYLKGWFCEASGARPSFQALACTLDKLVLDHDLSSPEATAFLRERMKRPQRCTADPVSQTVDTRARSMPVSTPFTRPRPPRY
jgi:hypothetical protein